MIKMPCLFVRDFHGRDSFTLTEQVTPGCEWVLTGEGKASRKRDGTACLWKDGQLWKRYDAKRDRKTGEYKPRPEGAICCSEPDSVTGHWPHWVPIGPHDYWHQEAAERQGLSLVNGATYELVGPKLQGNPEKFDVHTLIRHGEETVDCDLRWVIERVEREEASYPVLSFLGLRWFLDMNHWEGLVFAHPDGRYAKIRRNDYGLPWPVSSSSVVSS